MTDELAPLEAQGRAETMRPTVGSLFSGIGGLDLGLERAGFEVKWQVEIDAWCRKVLDKHWPGVKKYGDIREVKADELEPVTFLAGGFPCQPVSSAGKRLAQEDPRWLWPEFARFVRSLRPEFVLVENVAGLLGRGSGDILGDLATCGYDAEWQMLPAAAFGAPHIRERVFILAYPTSKRWASILCGDVLHECTPYPLWRKPASLGNAGDLLQELEQGLGEPSVLGTNDGTPDRVDRLSGCGNAILPQIGEAIGRVIMEVIA